MQPEERDMARLWDMLDAARATVQFTQGRRFEDLLSDRMLRSAVERNLEIAGEAARHITPETRDKNPDIPWTSIIGLRNIIAQDKLPSLIRQLEAMGLDSPPPAKQ